MKFKFLFKHPCAFVDLGSAREFLSQKSLKFLQGDKDLENLRSTVATNKAVYGSGVVRALWSPVILNYFDEHRTSLRMLEYLIAHEFLVLDEMLATNQTLHIAPELSEFFHQVDIPEDVREEAASEIFRIPQKTRQEIGAKGSTLWYASDKEMHDELQNMGGVYRRYCFANSEDSLERVYFYLNVIRRAGVALVLSPAKQELLTSFHQKIVRNLHDHLTAIATHTESVQGKEIELAFEPITTPFPPVQEIIIGKCLFDGISPIDAFLEIRKTEEAEHYRNYIHNLFLDYNGPHANRLQANEKLKEINTLMEKWRKDPYEGVRYQQYTIDLKKLPKIGFLPAMFGLPSYKLPKWMGKLLNPPEPEIVFMSRWFQAIGDPEQGH